MNMQHYELAKKMQAAGDTRTVTEIMGEIESDITALNPAPAPLEINGFARINGVEYVILGNGERHEKQP